MSKFKFNFDNLKEQMKTEGEKKGFAKDTRFWEQCKDKEHTVVIRFLPDMEGNGYVKVRAHAFQYTHNGKTKWYIDNCLNTFGYDRECPICEKNQIYYKSAFKKDNDLAAERSGKTSYISNIQIIKNPLKPEEEGKVFLFKYGKKIFEKIKSRLFPTDSDLQDDEFVQFNPFDLFEGANFKLKTVMQGEPNKRQYPNYDQSSFSAPSAVAGGVEAKLEKIMDQTVLLSEFIDESKFPTNEKVLQVLGGLLGMNGYEEETGEDASTTTLFGDDDTATTESDSVKESNDLPFDTDDEPAPTPEPAPKAGKGGAKATAAPKAATTAPAGDDDDEAFFADFN